MVHEVTILCLVFIAPLFSSLAFGEKQFSCYFIFGDSLVDNGNNNDLFTHAKANFLPYGIDYPEGPTGRFTNGRNIADIIAELFGFEKSIPPFATAIGVEILKGVNYGSGAAGIREETGQHLGDRISLSKQLRHHRITISRIAALLRNKYSVKTYLNKCVYTVGMGNNDYINNYLMPEHYISSHIYTPDQYSTLLIQQYSRQLKTLYRYGARMVGIFGLGDVGCAPFELEKYGTNNTLCVEKIGDAIQLFNIKLKQLVEDLNYSLPGAQFIFINQTSSGDSSVYGFTIFSSPCCEVMKNAAKGQCTPYQVPCTNRSQYVYWDAFHPTETAFKLLGALAYSTLSPFYNSPIDEYVSSI